MVNFNCERTYMLVGIYEFNCTLQSETVLPPYKGSTFRGAFGVALKRAVCAIKHTECYSCILNSRCIYAQTFETGNCVTKDSRSSAPSPPSPYIIEPPLESSTFYKAGSPFKFSLMLFGEVNKSLPYFVYAFEIMGDTGIGKKIKEHRGRFVLDTVVCEGDVIYDSNSKKLKSPAPKELLLEDSDKNSNFCEVKINFLTPLRLKHNNEFSSKLPFHVLVRAMLRRVSSLFENFGAGEPKLDYRGLIARSESICIKSANLHWHDWERYSNRQETAMLMGGLMGSITYSGDLAAYIGLIKLCQTLHIGKQTSFGLGLFEYETIVVDSP